VIEALAMTIVMRAVVMRKAASGAGSAAEHLWAVWECVHALRPDPGKAYWEAVKAVEAAHSLVYPDGDRRGRMATLGNMLPYLREHQEGQLLPGLRIFVW